MADSFLSRWSKRKAQVQAEEKDQEHLNDPISNDQDQRSLAQGSSSPPEKSPDLQKDQVHYQGPTMEDVKGLTKDSDFSAFVAKDIDPVVQQAAMKKLFADPHFNVMDGLDIYIDDYSKPDPLPAGMLQKMAQSSMLGLFKSQLEEASLNQQQGIKDGESLNVEHNQNLDLQPKSKDSETAAKLGDPSISNTKPDSDPA